MTDQFEELAKKYPQKGLREAGTLAALLKSEPNPGSVDKCGILNAGFRLHV